VAAQAVERGLVDELRMFRYPVVVGGGTPYRRVRDDSD
jgi:riboflavin biosynthesis pyrimidine reductase